MRHRRFCVTALGAMLLVVHGVYLVTPPLALAHPLGNFSISRYAGLRIAQKGIELRYLLDMAEIPTFLEIQESGIIPEVGHPSLRGYLDRQTVLLQEGLLVEVNGQRLPLQGVASEIVFPPGAGDLLTLKLGIVYRASLEAMCTDAPCHLHYRDSNFPGRLGWQEVIVVAEPGITVVQSSVPVPDRSRALTNYPDPWLGGISGLLITSPGCGLFLRRYVGESQAHTHVHSHAHHPSHLSKHAHHHETIHHDHPSPHEVSQAQSPVEETISSRALLALGVTGGIVPCPAALVVLLSAIALQRVGFGLLLIVAFSVGLAGVLITLGLLMVSTRHIIARLQGEGRLMTRWLPLTSAAVITVFGLAMIVQALATAGMVRYDSE